MSKEWEVPEFVWTSDVVMGWCDSAGCKSAGHKVNRCRLALALAAHLHRPTPEAKSQWREVADFIDTLEDVAGLDRKVVRSLAEIVRNQSGSAKSREAEAVEAVVEAAQNAVGTDSNGKAAFQPECNGSAQDLLDALAVLARIRGEAKL